MIPKILHTAALTALLFCGASHGAAADGRADWDGYAWQQIAIADCQPAGTSLVCPPFHEKWDWKRDQWVDIAITLDLAKGTLRLTQTLTNNDRRDTDDVCVTALAVDADGANIIAYHQNWEMRRGAVQKRKFSYNSAALGAAATLHIGSKQCRGGPGEDAALYARVLAGLPS